MPRLRWWREVLYILAFYLVYSFIRNQFGSAAVPRHEALQNARLVIRVERDLRIFHEESIQRWFLDWHGFIQFWNVFYGTFHFVVTAGCIIWLFRRFPREYVGWRTTLACTTALALIGFSLFPLLPPRLLPGTFHFVDTLQAYGGLWSFDSGAMSKVSNQYAAMPSLHFGWSLWCACVIVPRARRTWVKALAVVYPLCTLFAIVVTGNHYILDAAGGALVLAVGYAVGTWWARRASVPEVMLEESGR
jgi:membrane-associated phospholipid phosphatase